MARPRKVELLMASESFVVSLDGDVVPIRKGELIHPDHPIVRINREKFTVARPSRRLDVVEQATAAPGELRGDPVHMERSTHA